MPSVRRRTTPGSAQSADRRAQSPHAGAAAASPPGVPLPGPALRAACPKAARSTPCFLRLSELFRGVPGVAYRRNDDLRGGLTGGSPLPPDRSCLDAEPADRLVRDALLHADYVEQQSWVPKRSFQSGQTDSTARIRSARARGHRTSGTNCPRRIEVSSQRTPRGTASLDCSDIQDGHTPSTQRSPRTGRH